nr:dihydroxyacetone kinase subunit DhaL [uncultured Cohaesibacter sp.]
MTASISIKASGGLVVELIEAINANRAWLSEIDGAIGDGDHGINMSKGFTAAGEKLGNPLPSLPDALNTLSDTLIEDLGGSMGPLYGYLFSSMADELDGPDELDAAVFARMMHAAFEGVKEIGSADVGDKTLLDALFPAAQAFDEALKEGKSFEECLDIMSDAAGKGRDATKDMVAKVGRASRLGERSRGVLDAGATSCCLILQTLAKGIKQRMQA